MRVTIAGILAAALLAVAPSWGQQSMDQILNKGVVVSNQKPPAKQRSQSPANPPRSAAPPTTDRAASVRSAGFRMDLPPGWNARVEQNGAVLASSRDNAAVIIAPLWSAGEGGAASWLQQNGAAALRQYLNNAAITGIYPSRIGPNVALGSFDFSEGAGTAQVLCLINGSVGTLYVIAAPKAAFLQQRSGLVRILRSFSFTGERGTAEASRTSFTRFRDPNEGAFSLDVPTGWRVQGGLIRKSTLDVRPYLSLDSPDGSTLIRGRDPSIGTFITPGQMLSVAGLTEGMTYTPGYGNVWLISRYLPGPQFAQQYASKLATDTQCSGAHLTAVEQRQDLTKSEATGMVQAQTIGGEATFTCTRNGLPCAGKVVAATTILLNSASADRAVWNVDYLASYITPQEQSLATERIFQHIIASMEWDPHWVTMQNQTAYNTGQIARGAAQYTAQVFEDVSRNRERSEDRIHQNRIDSIRGVVRLRNPDTGEELEGVAGRNYYYQTPGGTAIGSDREIREPDFTELEQIR